MKVKKTQRADSKPGKKNGKISMVAREIQFARVLSGNEKKNRDKVLKIMKSWLMKSFNEDYDFSESDFRRLWRGLFHAVWMSDKPLVQEEVCEAISSILDLFPAEKYSKAALLFKAGFQLLAVKWFGIDHHRIDKFLMLIRRWLRGGFRFLKKCNWSQKSCMAFARTLNAKDGLFNSNPVVEVRNALGLQTHITDCYLEEVAKVSEGTLPPASLLALIKPFAVYMAEGTELRLCVACRRLFTYLLRQSDLGIEYEAKRMAWNRMGCPEGGPDALEPVSESDEEPESGPTDPEDVKHLDPRAGRVDVVLQSLPVPAKQIAALLKGLLGRTGSSSYRRVKICMQRFEELAQKQYPLRVAEDEVVRPPRLPSINGSLKKLVTLEDKLAMESDELMLKAVSRRKRKRILAVSRSGGDLSGLLSKYSIGTESASGEWKVEETKESETNLSNESEGKRKIPEEVPKEKRVKINGKKDTVKINGKKEVKINGKKEVKIRKERNEKTLKLQERGKIKKDSTRPKIRAKRLQDRKDSRKKDGPIKVSTPKRVQFVLKNNCMQKVQEYYQLVKSSPDIPFDSTKKPNKTNLKPNSAPSPINPFFKRKLRMQ